MLEVKYENKIYQFNELSREVVRDMADDFTIDRFGLIGADGSVKVFGDSQMESWARLAKFENISANLTAVVEKNYGRKITDLLCEKVHHLPYPDQAEALAVIMADYMKREVCRG